MNKKSRTANGQRQFAFERKKKLDLIAALDPAQLGISPRQMRTIRELLRQVELFSANGCEMSVELMCIKMGGLSRRTVERVRDIAVAKGLLCYSANQTSGHWRRSWQVQYRGLTNDEATSEEMVAPDELYWVDDMVVTAAEACDMTTQACDMTTQACDMTTQACDMTTHPIKKEENEERLELASNEACGEQAPPPPTEFVFPTVGKGGKTWTLSEPQLAEYTAAYPSMDIRQELRKARQWCLANPSRRKTAGGMLSFLTRWLNTANDRYARPRDSLDPRGNLALRDKLYARFS
jgi:hypothetical protein